MVNAGSLLMWYLVLESIFVFCCVFSAAVWTLAMPRPIKRISTTVEFSSQASQKAVMQERLSAFKRMKETESIIFEQEKILAEYRSKNSKSNNRREMAKSDQVQNLKMVGIADDNWSMSSQDKDEAYFRVTGTKRASDDAPAFGPRLQGSQSAQELLTTGRMYRKIADDESDDFVKIRRFGDFNKSVQGGSEVDQEAGRRILTEPSSEL